MKSKAHCDFTKQTSFTQHDGSFLFDISAKMT